MNSGPCLLFEGSGGQVPLRDPLSLGRSRDNDVPLQDAGVSSHHALIRLDQGRWILQDLNSTNGTWLNGQRVASPTLLSEGDLLQLGVHRFKVLGLAPPLPTLPVPALCGRCEAALPPGASFCPACGAPQGRVIPPVPHGAGPQAPGPRPSFPPAPAAAGSQGLLLGCCLGAVLMFFLGVLGLVALRSGWLERLRALAGILG